MDYDNMSYSELWNEIKKLRDEGVDIGELKYGSSKEDYIEFLEELEEELEEEEEELEEEEEEELEEEEEEDAPYIETIDDVPEEDEEEDTPEIVKFVPKQKPTKKFHRLFSDAGLKSYIGKNLEFKADWYKGSTSHLVNGAFIIKKFQKGVLFRGKLNVRIYRWIKTKWIKISRW